MGPLDSRTTWRILALWLAWFGLLATLVVLNLHREWQRQASARVSVESPGLGAGESNRLKVLPNEHTDFVYSVVVDNEALLKTVLLLLGPPGILTAVWLYVRRRWEPGPPT
jgi:hypothetical protein